MAKKIKKVQSFSLSTLLIISLLISAAGLLNIKKIEASPVQLFYSSMEESTFSDWTFRGTDWSQTGGAPGEKKCDNKAAKITANTTTTDGKNVIMEAIGTTDYDTITLNFWYRIKGGDYKLEAGDSIKVQWSINGTDWFDLHVFTNDDGINQTNANVTTWTEKTLVFPVDINNQANFRFRFIGDLYKTGGDKDEFWLDCVKLTGETISLVCTDNDSDGFSTEGGDCGPVDCNDSNAAINPGEDDSNCNDVDEDCDGTADGDYIPTPTTCGIGECASTGTMTCVAGAETDSCMPGTPESESCDNLDNDCDGSIDEDLTQSTSCGLGICSQNTGFKTCAAGIWGNDTCNPFQGAGQEACDGVNDENCDGTVDEGCACTNGDTKSCGQTDVGECSYGTQTCSGGAWGECEGTVNPGEEICGDQLDNDCDGATDEDCSTCVPITEICGNSIDEDCNGSDATCPSGGGSVATTTGGGGGSGGHLVVCGDRIRELSEECDDGNIVDGDGCSSICRTEQVAGATIEIAPQEQGEVLGESTTLPETGKNPLPIMLLALIIGAGAITEIKKLSINPAPILK